MSSVSKSAQLLANAKSAIDAIVHDPELDDDTKEEIIGELVDHLEESERMLSDDDDEEEEDEDDDDIEIDDEEEDEGD